MAEEILRTYTNGLHGRYNFSDRLYVTAKCDVGGFSVGSDFTWQTEAALGLQLTGSISAEGGAAR